MPTQELLVTLLGTLIGVFAAFRLDRAWERRQSKQQYGHISMLVGMIWGTYVLFAEVSKNRSAWATRT